MLLYMQLDFEMSIIIMKDPIKRGHVRREPVRVSYSHKIPRVWVDGVRK